MEIKLPEELLMVIEALEEEEDKDDLLTALETWLKSLAPVEHAAMTLSAVNTLQTLLIDIAKEQRFFRRATLLLANIYTDNTHDDDDEEEDEDQDDADPVFEFKDSFSAENPSIPVALKMQVLRELMNSEDNRAVNLAAFILETILPSPTPEYHAAILQMINEALKKQNPVFKERITDLLLVMSEQLVLADDFSEDLSSIIKQLGFSNKLLIAMLACPWVTLSVDGQVRYFAALDAIAPKTLIDKIFSFLFSSAFKFAPLKQANAQYVDDFIHDKIRLSAFIKSCAVAEEQDMFFIKKVAAGLMKDIIVLPHSEAGAQSFANILALIQRYTRELITDEDYQEEQMEWLAESLAKELALDKVGPVLEVCCNILTDPYLRYGFAIRFINFIYARSADAVQEKFKHNPQLLVQHGLLFKYPEKGGLLEWTPIAHLLLKNHFNSVGGKIVYEMQILDHNDREALFTSLLGGTEFPAAVEIWAGQNLAQIMAPSTLNKKRSAGNSNLANGGSHHKKLRVNFSSGTQQVLFNQWLPPNALLQPTTYTAMHAQAAFSFEERKVPGDGHCAFTAAGVNQHELVNTLRGLAVNPEVREQFAPEIRFHFLTMHADVLASFKNGVQSPLLAHPIIGAISNYMLLGTQLDDLKRKVLLKYPELNLENTSLEACIATLPVGNEDKATLVTLNDNLEQFNSQLNVFCAEKGVYEYYVSLFATQAWGSIQALIHYARATQMDLCIWQNNDPKKNELTLVEFNGDPSDPAMRHVIFKFDHFDLLQRTAIANEAQHSPILSIALQ